MRSQKKAYILADNRLALDAGWDKELLALEIGSLQGEAVASFRAPVAGLEPVHYHADIAPLLRAAGLAGCGPHHTGLSQ